MRRKEKVEREMERGWGWAEGVASTPKVLQLQGVERRPKEGC